jgi:hypothetical protein
MYRQQLLPECEDLPLQIDADNLVGLGLEVFELFVEFSVRLPAQRHAQ